ncbi:MAG TPA: 50S ribosomal protein L25 [Candidatus Saccharimonadaceae bacterium]|nr:50S ribosomal protein L25 [Candidatus Saccharimonadaceae bacterium]
MHDFSLKLEARTASGKKVAALRKEGTVPSVVYGGQDEPISTQSELVATTKVVHGAGRHSPVKLTIDGKKKLAIIKDIDFDPVKQVVRHVAFHAIKENEIITTDVPVVLTGKGESAAEKAGLIILQAIERVEIKAKPADLPESIELSIADLATTEDRLTIADLQLPSGVEFADAEQHMDLVIANVYEPAALEAANDAAAGSAEDESEVESENGEADSDTDSDDDSDTDESSESSDKKE